MDELWVALFGLAGGLVGGLLGIGGGILFVPGIAIFMDEPQLRAEATSLLAIVPMAIIGTWRQHSYGNVDFKVAALLGVLSVPGVALGVVLANAVPQRALELGFAALLLFVASQLIRRGLRGRSDPAPAK